MGYLLYIFWEECGKVGAINQPSLSSFIPLLGAEIILQFLEREKKLINDK
jgi:hypothetical protein